MDSDSIVGLAAVILIFGGGTLVLLSISPVGKAIAARLLGKKPVGGEADEETAQEVKELRHEIEEMRHLPEHLSELGERVDFLERMVAKQRDVERLPPVR